MTVASIIKIGGTYYVKLPKEFLQMCNKTKGDLLIVRVETKRLILEPLDEVLKFKKGEK